jgi:hypothetical protein
MMTLKETIFNPNGETTITEKNFGSKNEIIKILKKQSPLNNKVIYELSKYGEAFCEVFGVKRKFEIYSERVAAREAI